MKTQELINNMYRYLEARRKQRDAAYDRTIHNKLIQDLIDELSDQEE